MALGAYALEDEARELFSYLPQRIIANQRTGSHSHGFGLLQGHPVCVEQACAVYHYKCCAIYTLVRCCMHECYLRRHTFCAVNFAGFGRSEQ